MINIKHTSLAGFRESSRCLADNLLREIGIRPLRYKSIRFGGYFLAVFLLLAFVVPTTSVAPLRDVAYLNAGSQQAAKAMGIETQIQGLFGRFRMPITGELIHEMTRVSIEDHIDPRLVAAIIIAESSGDPLAISHGNALGLMQINARVWSRQLDFSRNNPFDPLTNLRMGIPILQSCMARYHWLDSALAAYVGDPDNSVPETAAYVDRIIRIFEKSSGTKVARNPVRRVHAPQADLSQAMVVTGMVPETK